MKKVRGELGQLAGGDVDRKGPSRIFCRPIGTEEKQALERRDLGWKRSDGGQFPNGLEPEREPGKDEVTTVTLCEKWRQR